ncbi:MAG TPA: hypothetical protein VI197_03100 [Polyangiaceae bacterium]
MRVTRRDQSWLANVFVITLCACGGSGEDGSKADATAGATTSQTSTGAATTVTGTTASASGNSTTAGTASAAAATGTPGSTSASANASTGNSNTGAGGGDAGATTTDATATATDGVDGGPGGSGGGCSIGAWPAADPAAPGPFATVTEENVGPLAGVGEDDEPVAFTLFRPEVLGESGLCHPVVTWGNGTGSNPSLYGILLRHLASHGFVVIASNSPNVADGDPPPMVAGVTWVLEQNDDPTSALYRQIDVTHVGATGHSQGGFATSRAGGDSQITTIAPLCGAATQRNLHGPALLLCGGLDEVVTCDTVQNAFDATDEQPVMLANYLTADHADWVTFFGDGISPMETAVTAWMRVHLMDDTSLRPWFYGTDCELCTDSAWEISQKLMDE